MASSPEVILEVLDAVLPQRRRARGKRALAQRTVRSVRRKLPDRPAPSRGVLFGALAIGIGLGAVLAAVKLRPRHDTGGKTATPDGGDTATPEAPASAVANA
ncbi:MAG TPA: hypothetical protein VNT03_00970 [Baekduia sp.]|nr:hypothetical protein [Baekduia sp.]